MTPARPTGNGGWTFHLTFDLADDQALALRRGHDWTVNGLELFQARVDVERLEGITSAFYFAYGATAGYMSARSEVCKGTVVCSDKEHCSCEGEGASWKTLGFAYGPVLGLALVGMASDKTGVVVWMPVLKASHYLSAVHGGSSECAMGPELCPDSSFSAGTFMLEAGLGFDGIYRGGAAGCGFRLNAVHMIGDVEKRQSIGAMLSFSMVFGVSLFDRY